MATRHRKRLISNVESAGQSIGSEGCTNTFLGNATASVLSQCIWWNVLDIGLELELLCLDLCPHSSPGFDVLNLLISKPLHANGVILWVATVVEEEAVSILKS